MEADNGPVRRSGVPSSPAPRETPRPWGRRGDPMSRPGGSRRVIALVGGLLVLMLAGGALTAVLSGNTSGVSREKLAAASVKPASVSNRALPASLAAMMGLERSHHPVTGFTLTNQHGQPVQLSHLDRHHAVVLTFMDDRCRDICPLVAQELVDAYHKLGPAAAKVDFVAVNVNAAHNAPVWLRRFIASSGHGIGAVPTFSYLTGSPGKLRGIWSRWGITVQVAANGTVVHSEAMYFIAPGGRVRYVATPYANLRKNGTGWLPLSTITGWGNGIARYAKASLDLAPAP